MATTSRHGVETRYHAAEIILSGDPWQVHTEAERILRRFAASASPYRIAKDRGGYMVLKRGGS